MTPELIRDEALDEDDDVDARRRKLFTNQPPEGAAEPRDGALRGP